MDKDYFNMAGYNIPPYFGYDTGVDPNMIQQQQPDNTVFNPMIQYEQAYMYYRYLAEQMEYKIKCKEYEKLTNSSDNNRPNSRKIE